MAEKQSLPGRPARPDENRLVFIGVLVKPQGVRGGIRMLPEFDDLDDFEDLKTDRLFLKTVSPPGSLRPAPATESLYRELTIREFFPHQRYVVLFFEEVPDMDTADLLRSQEIYVYEDELWDLPEGKYYAYQLAGLELYNLETQQVAGTVRELRPGVQDYLVVDGPNGEFLVPYVPDIVMNVDLSGKRINAKLPEGISEI